VCHTTEEYSQALGIESCFAWVTAFTYSDPKGGKEVNFGSFHVADMKGGILRRHLIIPSFTAEMYMQTHEIITFISDISLINVFTPETELEDDLPPPLFNLCGTWAFNQMRAANMYQPQLHMAAQDKASRGKRS
jgi:hypothetical protein